MTQRTDLPKPIKLSSVPLEGLLGDIKSQGVTLEQVIDPIPTLYAWSDEFLPHLDVQKIPKQSPEVIVACSRILAYGLTDGSVGLGPIAILLYAHLKRPDPDASTLSYVFDNLEESLSDIPPRIKKALQGAGEVARALTPQSRNGEIIDSEDIMSEFFGTIKEPQGEDETLYTWIKRLSSSDVEVVGPVIAGLCLRMITKEISSTLNSIQTKLPLILNKHYSIRVKEADFKIHVDALKDIKDGFKAGDKLIKTVVIWTLGVVKNEAAATINRLSGKSTTLALLTHLFLLHTEFSGLQLFNLILAIKRAYHASLIEMGDALNIPPLAGAMGTLFQILFTYAKEPSALWKWSRLVDPGFFATLGPRAHPHAFAVLMTIVHKGGNSSIDQSVVYKNVIKIVGKRAAGIWANMIIKRLQDTPAYKDRVAPGMEESGGEDDGSQPESDEEDDNRMTRTHGAVA